MEAVGVVEAEPAVVDATVIICVAGMKTVWPFCDVAAYWTTPPPLVEAVEAAVGAVSMAAAGETI